MATCNWGGFESTEYWPLVCMEEGNQSGDLWWTRQRSRRVCHEKKKKKRKKRRRLVSFHHTRREMVAPTSSHNRRDTAAWSRLVLQLTYQQAYWWAPKTRNRYYDIGSVLSVVWCGWPCSHHSQALYSLTNQKHKQICQVHQKLQLRWKWLLYVLL